MKKTFLYISILTLFLSLLTNCKTQKKESPLEVKKIEKIPEIETGWISPHTYRIIATGEPTKNITDQKARRQSSKDDALIKAKKIIIKIFVKSKLQASNNLDLNAAYLSVKRDFYDVIENGKIKETKYFDNDNCEIIYEIESENLKQKVLGK